MVRSDVGPLEHSSSARNQAILSAVNMAPGDATSGTVTITNSAARAAALSLSTRKVSDRPGRYRGRLSRGLKLRIEDRASRSVVYTGPLGKMPTLRLGVFRGGEARRYRFTVLFPDRGTPSAGHLGDNAYQGSSVTVTYLWRTSETRDRPGVVRAGTAGDDVLIGTAGDDVIRCGAGQDRAYGGGGNDVVECGSGADVISGGPGNDRLFGGSGNDRLEGGPGDDLLVGASGDDRLVGGRGRDRLLNGTGGVR